MPEAQNTRRALIWLWLSGLIIMLDQVTKILATAMLNYADPVPVLPCFNLTLVHNYGAAFSFLADAGGWQRWFFTGLAIIISAVLLIWLSRLPARPAATPLALVLILGGAVGNLIDRIRFGYVVDFLDFYYQTWHYPAFNIADSAITAGAILLIVDTLFWQDGH